MRLPLEGGQWADLRERLTYGQGRGVRSALLAIDADRTAMVDLDLALINAYLVGWHVLDIDGQAVPSDTPELAPDDVVQAVALKAMDLWKGRADPKGLTAHSATTSQARQSRSRTKR